jgi:hypothetical protein
MEGTPSRAMPSVATEGTLFDPVATRRPFLSSLHLVGFFL